ncbi:MAG: DUF493 domain-containing protein [Lentisphaeraceae bacterium]|nr:DUF493 domain-containing protein [Lentisphaeraceae bacterium]
MFEDKEIEFPVDWQFRIICDAKIDITDALVAVLNEFGISELPKTANQSSGGKYQSYSVNAIFHDKATMDFMATKLSAISGVKMVL